MGALAALLQVLFPEVDELDEALELELELDALELDELELLDETLELLELLTELELLDDTLELLELLIELDEELELIALLEETEPPPPHPTNATEPTTAKRKLTDAFKVRLPEVFMQGRPLVDICRKRFQTAPPTVVFLA